MRGIRPTLAVLLLAAAFPVVAQSQTPAFTLSRTALQYDFTPYNNVQPLVQTVNLGSVDAPGGLSYSTSLTTTCPATVPVACSTLNWLGVSPPIGTTPQALVVTVYPAVVSVSAPPGLDSRYYGNYTAAVTIHDAAPNPTAADVVISVTFFVGHCLPSYTTPSTVKFTLINGVTGVVSPAPSQTITLNTCALLLGGGLAFQGILSINTPNGSNWVTMPVSSGTTDAQGHGTITLQLDPPAAPNFLTPTVGTAVYSATLAIQLDTSQSWTVTPVTLQVVGQPQQALTPSSFAFPNHTIGVTTPGAIAAALTTAAVSIPVPFVATPLAFTATPTVSPNEKCGSSWLAVDPNSGTTTGTSTPTPLTVSYFAAGLVDDQTDYACHGNIIVNTPGAAVPAIAYSVTLNVLRRPRISTDLPPPASLTFTPCGPGGPTRTITATFTLSATGGNALDIASVTAGTIPANQGWLSVTPNSGRTPQTFTVTVNLGNLSTGTFDGNIILIVPQAANSPFVVPVTFVPIPCPCSLTLSAPSVSIASGSGTFTSLAGSFTVIPQGGCFWMAYRGADSLGRGLYWVTSITPASGNGSAATTVYFTVFTNTTTAQRAGAINVQNGTFPAPTFTITQAGSIETLPQREVRALYQTVLYREPDQGGFYFWTGPGAGAPLQAADGFYTSNEFLHTGYMAGAIYSAVLGRVPTQTEWIAADAMLRPANTSAADIQAAQQQLVDQLLASAEYGGSGGPKAAPCTLYTCPDFLTRLYQTALGRSPDPDGYAFWYNLLSNGTLTQSEVVLLFISSPEFEGRTNLLYVTLLYYTILGRTPDAGGLAFWISIVDACPGILFSTTPACIETRYLILGPNYRGSQGFLGSPEWQRLIQ